jgi:hypothetical protein
MEEDHIVRVAQAIGGLLRILAFLAAVAAVSVVFLWWRRTST